MAQGALSGVGRGVTEMRIGVAVGAAGEADAVGPAGDAVPVGDGSAPPPVMGVTDNVALAVAGGAEFVGLLLELQATRRSNGSVARIRACNT
jgi:hypothetical protein